MALESITPGDIEFAAHRLNHRHPENASVSKHRM